MTPGSSKFQNQYHAFERALKKGEHEQFLLRLYVTGASAKSLRAIQNIKQICEEHLKGRYRLEVIDVYQQPVLARGEQIVAAPTLIKYLPEPLRRFIGDMASAERILVGLDLRPSAPKQSTRAKPGAKPRRKQGARLRKQNTGGHGGSKAEKRRAGR